MIYSQLTPLDINTVVKRINTICDNMFHTYLNKYPNVIGIGLGFKNKAGTPINYPTLSFLVTEKINKSQLTSNEIIPPVLEGIPTDVIVSDELSPLSFSYYNQYQINSYKSNTSELIVYPKATPPPPSTELLQGGDSVSYVDSKFSGTIACAVRDEKYIYILSSGHSLGRNGVDNPEDYCPIISPSASNGGTSANLIGNLYKNIIPNFSVKDGLSLKSNIIDAAIVSIGDINHKDNILTDTLKKGVNGYPEIALSTVDLGDYVVKVGASSKKTKGTVIMTNAAIKVNISGKTAIYIHQIVTTSMATIGDSGSLGLKETNPATSAFGLLMAGSKSVTVYNPLSEVLKNLNVTLLNSTN